MFIDNVNTTELLSDKTVAGVIQSLIMMCEGYDISRVVLRKDRYPDFEYELQYYEDLGCRLSKKEE